MPLEQALSGVKAGERYTLTVEKVTHGGAGLAHVDGLPIFIPKTIPGQEVEITVTRRRESYAEARVERLCKPAKDEIRPRCAHFHECGGVSGRIFRTSNSSSTKRTLSVKLSSI